MNLRLMILSSLVSCLLGISGLGGPLAAQEQAPLVVPNFALLDQEGRSHELDYYCRIPGTKGVVIFIQGNGCPLVQKRIKALKRYRGQYKDKGIHFLMLNANLQDTREEILAEADAFDIYFPILMDEGQDIAPLLNLERTAETLLIKADTRELVYRGGIDDRLTYQKEKPKASKHYLREALDSLLAGEAPNPSRTEAPGCKITLEEPRTDISYAEHVAPILKSRCVSCHTPGGIGPFALTSHRKVRGWSEMIEEVIITRQMPPWHADPHIGRFVEDQGLRYEERKLLLDWIRQGSPRGEGPDPLANHKVEPVEWPMGVPDKILHLPVQTVPAEGVFDYRYAEIESPFDEDVWLSAIEVNPGNERVVHHVVVSGFPKSLIGKPRTEKYLTAYAPGTRAWPAPEGTGIKLPKDSVLKFQVHYAASGREEVDAMTIGLHLVKGPVERELRTRPLLHTKFKIPPYVMEHPGFNSYRLKHDISLYSINFHMHYRGKHMRFSARYPDGSETVLLSVPNYNFNWQRTYFLEQPMDLPKGTKLIVRNAWDNSVVNLHNPDPSVEVLHGEQTTHEMSFVTYQYTIED